MAIKKLQNDYTTPEQSKRLLELGVPAESANYYYQKNKKEDDYELFVGESFAIKENLFSYRYGYTLPCWSVGRLIEIRDICAKYYITHNDFKGNYIEDIIMSFYAIHATNGFDFSKLEE